MAGCKHVSIYSHDVGIDPIVLRIGLWPQIKQMNLVKINLTISRIRDDGLPTALDELQPGGVMLNLSLFRSLMFPVLPWVLNLRLNMACLRGTGSASSSASLALAFLPPE